jgi:hypothetical protein
LREVELDSGKIGLQLLEDLGGKVVLVAELLAPLAGRLQRREELGVEQAGGVGAVIRAPMLLHHRLDLREAANDLAHAVHVTVAFLERDRRRHGGADPDCLFEFGQEFKPEATPRRRRTKGTTTPAIASTRLATARLQCRRVQAVQHAHDPGFGFAHVIRQQDGADRRRHGERREQAASRGIGMIFAIRAEDVAFDAAEREQRQEARDDDAGRKKIERLTSDAA